MYRVSVPVKRCTLSIPKLILPLCAVRLGQSFSECATVHFTFNYTSKYLRTVRPVQSFSACTTVRFIYTYTSTPPMGRTACTELQSLYNGAL